MGKLTKAHGSLVEVNKDLDTKEIYSNATSMLKKMLQEIKRHMQHCCKVVTNKWHTWIFLKNRQCQVTKEAEEKK